MKEKKSINCTVVELKQANQAVGSQHGRVLIVPLWN